MPTLPRTILSGVPAAFAAVLLLAGCSRNTTTEQPGATTAPPEPGAQQQQQNPQGQLPPGHPPLDQMPQGGPQGGPAGGQQIVPPAADAGTGQNAISWNAPKDWVAEQPSSSMRRAQYKVPGPGGDAECAVFYFGPGQGGDPKANAQRWISQFSTPDGKPVEGKTSETKVNGVPVVIVEAKGSYNGAMSMGMSHNAPSEKPGYALLGAVIEGPDSNWFFKLTGPEKTIDAQRGNFDALVKSVKKGA